LTIPNHQELSWKPFSVG